MSGYRENHAPVARRTFNGVRFRCYVTHPKHSRHWLVNIERVEWVSTFRTSAAYRDKPWRKVVDGVALPIQFQHRYRAEALAKIINQFLRVYKHLERDDAARE